MPSVTGAQDNYLFRDGDLHVLSEDCRAALSVLADSHSEFIVSGCGDCDRKRDRSSVLRCPRQGFHAVYADRIGYFARRRITVGGRHRRIESQGSFQATAGKRCRQIGYRSGSAGFGRYRRHIQARQHPDNRQIRLRAWPRQ